MNHKPYTRPVLIVRDRLAEIAAVTPVAPTSGQVTAKP